MNVAFSISNPIRPGPILLLGPGFARTTLGNTTLGFLPVTGEDLCEFRLLPDPRTVPVEDVDGDDEEDCHEA